MKTPFFEPEWELPEELVSIQGEALEDAIAEYSARLEDNPTDLDAYHVLYQLFHRVGEIDRAWCLAGLLAVFGKTTRREFAFYAMHSSHGLALPSTPLDHGMWTQCVMAEGDHQRLGPIFELLYQSLGDILATRKLKEFGLSDKNRVDLEQPMLFCSTLKSCAHALGLKVPAVYLNERQPGINLLPVMPVALSVGEDMLAGKREGELAFWIAKYLTYLHPWHVMAAIYDAHQLTLLLMATAALTDEQLDWKQARSDMGAEVVEQLAYIQSELEKRLSPAERTLIDRTASWLVGEIDPEDILNWYLHVEYTANHAGTFVANDIELVGKILLDYTPPTPLVSRADVVRDFVTYVASERYLILREFLGVSVEEE